LGMGAQPHLWKQLMPDGMQRMGQRPEAERKQMPVPDFSWRQLRQLFPVADPFWQPHHRAGWKRLAARHGGAPRYLPRKVVPEVHVLLALGHDLRFIRRALAAEGLEIADIIH